MGAYKEISQGQILKQLLQTSTEGFWHIDNASSTLDVNPAMCRILDRDKTEILGRPIFDFVDDENRNILRREIAERNRGKQGSYEIAMQRPDGSNVACINNAIALHDEDGRKVGAIGIFTDISKQKSIEMELRHSEARLAEAQSIAKIGHWRWDTVKDVFITGSEEYARIHGMSMESITKLMNENSAAVIHPADRKRVAMVNRDRGEKGIDYEIEYRIVRSDGEVRDVYEICKSVFDDDGVAVEQKGIIQDITSRKALERQIDEHTEDLRRQSIVVAQSEATANYGHWMWDEVNDTCIHCSDGLARLHGVNVEEYMQAMGGPDKAFERCIPEDSENFHDTWVEMLTECKPYQIDYRFRRPDGKIRWFNEVGAPFGVSEDGTVLTSVGIVRDISEQKRIEQVLIASLDEAERANNAKSDFLSSMSHELRTPMNAVMGFTQLLASNPKEPLSEDQSFAVKHILKGGEHLLGLIEQVLELNKIEAGQLSFTIDTMSPRDTIDHCLHSMQAKAVEQGVEIRDLTAGGKLPSLRTDETGLTQALLNLLSNAIKYNVRGGSVSLDCREIDNGFVRIGVADTGSGIPTDQHDRLFKPFERLGRESGEIEGTGIGLTITKTIIEHMGGKIGYESKSGKGSKFWIDLPIGHEQPAESGPASNPALDTGETERSLA